MIKSITYSLSETIPLQQNYANAKPHISITVENPNGITTKDMYDGEAMAKFLMSNYKFSLGLGAMPMMPENIKRFFSHAEPIAQPQQATLPAEAPAAAAPPPVPQPAVVPGATIPANNSWGTAKPNTSPSPQPQVAVGATEPQVDDMPAVEDDADPVASIEELLAL